MTTPSQISCALAPQVDQLWQATHALKNEIITTVPGRCITPALIYSITGLNPEKMYTLSVRMELVGNKIWNYIKGEYVESISAAVEESSSRKVRHVDGYKPGNYWMAHNFDFNQVRITVRKSKEVDSPSHIHLQIMRRYIPVVSVYEEGKLVHEVKIPYTEFITVHHYSNRTLATWRKLINPYDAGKKWGLHEKKLYKEEDFSLARAFLDRFGSLSSLIANHSPAVRLTAYRESLVSCRNKPTRKTSKTSFAHQRRNNLKQKNKKDKMIEDNKNKKVMNSPIPISDFSRSLSFPYPLSSFSSPDTNITAHNISPYLPQFNPFMSCPMMFPPLPTSLLTPDSLHSMTPYTTSTGTPVSVSEPDVEEDNLEIDVVSV